MLLIRRCGRVLLTKLSLTLGIRKFTPGRLYRYSVSLHNINSCKTILPAMSSGEDRSNFILENDTPFPLLSCDTAFGLLTAKQKKYAHHIAKASWAGGLIVLLQTSPEAAGLFTLFNKAFSKGTEFVATVAKDSKLTDEEYKALIVYIAGVYGSMGNYKSFGDSKFIPGLPKEKFAQCLSNTGIAETQLKDSLKSLLPVVFGLHSNVTTLGFRPNSITNYFSGNCTIEDANAAKEFLASKSLSAYNTRLIKYRSSAGEFIHEVRLASILTDDNDAKGIFDPGLLGKVHKFKFNGGEYSFKITRGDYSPLLQIVVDELKLAKEFAANDVEKKMIDFYVEAFTYGSTNAHKDASRQWIKDKSPVVERFQECLRMNRVHNNHFGNSYIGFIESYRDPIGTRGEFEGFSAIVNKVTSERFSKLVENSETYLTRLPWPKEFEKDKFLRPDFTALDVLAFAGSGPPAGINIPNYNEIRQNEGFKNVALSNVVSSGYKAREPQFVSKEDKELLQKFKLDSFEVHVGLHELLGHGSGKLFVRNKDGTFNFNRDTVNPLTKEKVSKWYEAEETWETKFKTLSSPMEECRAECVGLLLSCCEDIVESVFGHKGSDVGNIIYVNWLSMVVAGVQSLMFYSMDSQKWTQAHMHARHVILRVLLEAKHDLVTVKQIVGEDGKPDMLINLNRDLIATVGLPAISEFLVKLQVHRSTGDYDSALKLFDYYCSIDDKREICGVKLLDLRNIVIARKRPRPILVQCNTYLEGNDVKLKEYDSSAEGMIQSFIERFDQTKINKIMYDLWKKDLEHFPLQLS